ncbi:MAG: dihydrofolate reductase family protein [Candidatus Yanofskybacteria bacterium]|nr:dihydrofolate reductase family protein [Candidatus Yanofskybacteria bacterium]
MKTFLIAALTADGFIAKNSDHSPLIWRSEADRRFFIGRTKEAGLVIMGLNTAKASKKPLPGRRNVIYAKSAEELPHWKEYGEWEVTQENPHDLLLRLEKDGHREAAICGGATIYTMFLEAGLIDTMYLSVEPWIFGQGIHLFQNPREQKLKLLSVRQEEETVFLEYSVLHS